MIFLFSRRLLQHVQTSTDWDDLCAPGDLYKDSRRQKNGKAPDQHGMRSEHFKILMDDPEILSLYYTHIFQPILQGTFHHDSQDSSIGCQLEPVAKVYRKCCVNGKVESGALKISFFGSESLLHRVVQERWNTRVFQRSFLYTLVAGLREPETSEDLKLARGCLPLAPFFKTPQFYGVCCASTRSNAAARAV